MKGLHDMEKRLQPRENLLSPAFGKNIPGDRREFPVLLEAAATRGAPTAVLAVAPRIRAVSHKKG